MATIGDLTSSEHRTRAMAIIGISIGITFSLSLVIGPLIASFWSTFSFCFDDFAVFIGNCDCVLLGANGPSK